MIIVKLSEAIAGCVGVSDRGDGTYRVDFTDSARDATQAEILAAAKASRVDAINVEATARIVAAYPLEKQSSALMGVYPQAYKDAMTADIAEVIQASNTACDLVDAAASVAAVYAVVVNWPVIGA